MPALTIVTFRDEDGDEFPIALTGFPPEPLDSEALAALESIARERVDEFVREGSLRLTGDVSFVRVEGPGEVVWEA